MSKILHGNNHVFENSLIKITKKLCQNILHKEMLLRYKNCKTFPKGLHLKFNLSLCKEDRNLQRNCNFILRAAAGKIQDEINKALNIKISLPQEKIRNLPSVVKRISKKQFKSLNCKMKRINDKERKKIKQRQIRKYNRDNLVIKTCKKKNRRFSRKQLRAKSKEKRRKRRDKKYRDDILTIWTHGSDTLESFLDYLNQINSTGKIKFTMQVQGEDGIVFRP